MANTRVTSKEAGRGREGSDAMVVVAVASEVVAKLRGIGRQTEMSKHRKKSLMLRDRFSVYGFILREEKKEKRGERERTKRKA